MSKAQEMREIADAINDTAKEKQAERTLMIYQTKILPQIKKYAKEGVYSYYFVDEYDELDSNVITSLATKDEFNISSYLTWHGYVGYAFSWNKPTPKTKRGFISFKLRKKD